MLQTKLYLSSAYHLETDGRTEVVNKMLSNMLRCLVQDHLKLWDAVLGQTKFAYNSMTNRLSGKSPFSIVYAKIPNHTLDLAIIPKCKNKATKTWVADVVCMIQEVRTKLNEPNTHYKEQANGHKRWKVFNQGDLVMVQLWKEHFPSRTYAKLSPRKLGPFVITKCINNNAYIIDLPSNVFTPPTLNVFNIHPHYPPNNAKTTISSLRTSSTEMKKMIDDVVSAN